MNMQLSKKYFFLKENINTYYYKILKTDNQFINLIKIIGEKENIENEKINLFLNLVRNKKINFDFLITKISLYKEFSTKFINLTSSKYYTDSKIINSKKEINKTSNFNNLVGIYYEDTLNVYCLILFDYKKIITEKVVLDNIIENSIFDIKTSLTEVEINKVSFNAVLESENFKKQEEFISKTNIEKSFFIKEKEIDVEENITVFDIESYEEKEESKIKNSSKGLLSKHIPYCFIVGSISIRLLKNIKNKNLNLVEIKTIINSSHYLNDYSMNFQDEIKKAFKIIYYKNTNKIENSFFLKKLLYEDLGLESKCIYTFNGKAYDLQILRNLFVENIAPSEEVEENYFAFDGITELSGYIYELRIRLFDYIVYNRKLKSLERDKKVKNLSEIQYIQGKNKSLRSSFRTLRFRDIRTILSSGSLDSISKQLNLGDLGKYSKANTQIKSLILSNIKYNKLMNQDGYILKLVEDKVRAISINNNKPSFDIKFIIYYGYCYKHKIKISKEEQEIFELYALGDVISLLFICKSVFEFTSQVLKVDINNCFTAGSIAVAYWKNLLKQKTILRNKEYLNNKFRIKKIESLKKKHPKILEELRALKEFNKNYKWKPLITIPKSKIIQGIFSSTKDGGLIICKKFHQNIRLFNYLDEYSKDFDISLSNTKKTIKDLLIAEKNIFVNTLNKSEIKNSVLLELDVNSLYPTAMLNYKYPIGEYKIKRVTIEELEKLLYDNNIMFIACNLILESPYHKHLMLPKTVRDSNGDAIKRTYAYYKDKEVNITCEYLKLHLKQGFKIKYIEYIIYWEESDYIYKDFVENLYKLRKKFDVDYGDKSPFGNFCKLTLNSLYGKMLQGLYNETINIVPTNSISSKHDNAIINKKDILPSDISMLTEKQQKEILNLLDSLNQTSNSQKDVYKENIEELLEKEKLFLNEREKEDLFSSFNFLEEENKRVSSSKRYSINNCYDLYIKIDLEKDIAFPSFYGSYILSYSKTIMLQYLNILKSNNIEHYYTDTDSIYTDVEGYRVLEPHISSNKIGKLSIDGIYLGGIFFGNKTKMLLEVKPELYKADINSFINNIDIHKIPKNKIFINKTFKGFKDISDYKMFKLLMTSTIIQNSSELNSENNKQKLSRIIKELLNTNNSFWFDYQTVWKKGIDMGVHTYVSKKRPTKVGPQDSSLNLKDNNWYSDYSLFDA